MQAESNEVHCFKANLSEHDLESVCGLSARAGMNVSLGSLKNETHGKFRTRLPTHDPQLCKGFSTPEQRR